MSHSVGLTPNVVFCSISRKCDILSLATARPVAGASFQAAYQILNEIPKFHMSNQKTILVILDGWGNSPDPKVSAIAQAQTPFVDHLYAQYPHTELVTYGEEVGLPEGQMGNSEVGHLNIGAGRVVYQALARINKSIRERELHQNPILLNALAYAKAQGKKVHLLGLLSDGGVHSHINHLMALCDIMGEQGVPAAYIHAFMDGRDTDPKGGAAYLDTLQSHLSAHQLPVQVASMIGRYYAMDRDKRWERVKLAYDLLVHGKGEATTDFGASLAASYAAGTTDEFIAPLVGVDATGQPLATIEADDVVVFFNFRTDRPRELTEVLTQQAHTELGMTTRSLRYLTMTNYDATFKGIEVLFEKEDVTETLGEVLAQAGRTQLRIAETEKYPHVTFFFNGGREAPFEGEARLIVPSPKVATYDLQPEMSAPEVTAQVIAHIKEAQPDFICLNYANADMVGHTGDFDAAVRAVEAVDKCLAELFEVLESYDYDAIVIADHGNSDTMINPDGSPNTAHTTNPVPCFLVSPRASAYQLQPGKLADVAPTLLQLMGVAQPSAMGGVSLLRSIH